MTETHGDSPGVLDQVDPEWLATLLQDHGWRLVGRRSGVYYRLAGPDEEGPLRGSFVVPLDLEAPEFRDMMGSLIRDISTSRYRDTWERAIFPRLLRQTVDEFRFKKESSAPRGLISWTQGVALIDAARSTLMAGAKAYIETDRYYSNRHGRFANRYMDEVLMGQTGSGSYVVTAFAPTSRIVETRSSRNREQTESFISETTVRDVTLSVLNAVEATVEAVEHARDLDSYAGFEVGVARGISYEMTQALKGIAEQSDGSEIDVELDMSTPVPGRSRVAKFILDEGAVPVLETAAARLVTPEPAKRIRFSGRVHLLTRKEAGGPGVVGMESFAKEPPHKVRVHLTSEDDYHLAVKAHDEEFGLLVTGDLQREGNINWLYRARILESLSRLDAQSSEDSLF